MRTDVWDTPGEYNVTPPSWAKQAWLFVVDSGAGGGGGSGGTPIAPGNGGGAGGSGAWSLALVPILPSDAVMVGVGAGGSPGAGGPAGGGAGGDGADGEISSVVVMRGGQYIISCGAFSEATGGKGGTSAAPGQGGTGATVEYGALWVLQGSGGDDGVGRNGGLASYSRLTGGIGPGYGGSGGMGGNVNAPGNPGLAGADGLVMITWIG
jgi:hypothetical protein